jgi:tetratricopeptide (TPR) repeat protein
MADSSNSDTVAASLAALRQAALAKRLVIFCGAGVSMLAPSRSPSWWEIYVAAARALVNRLRESFPECVEYLSLEALLEPVSTQQLADLVSASFAGPTFADLLKVVDIADANENHRAIATLAASGGARLVVTTNFDTLIERAAAVRNVRFAIAAPGISVLRRADDDSVLVKLHGSTVDPSGMIETTRQKAREISHTLRAAWGPLVTDADVLVVGYSGADLNFGAARAFFADVLAVGGRIWWLHRTGAAPTLTSSVAARTTLIEDRLPDFLRALVASLGEQDFDTPVTGRDAQAALTSAMEKWSREIHIGGWAGATFCLSLCEHAADASKVKPLRDALLQLARERVKNFEPGMAITLADLGAAIFLGSAGMQALKHMDLDGAKVMLRASVNIYGGMDAALGETTHEQSYNERQMNLASSWSNYAQTHLLSGERDQAVSAFLKSLHYAYLGGHTHSALISLGNVLHAGFELNQVRRCLRLAHRAVTLADRVGAVQSSIELRLLLAMYHCDRSEIWIAAELLEEARRSAASIGSRFEAAAAVIQLGECAIRSGQVVRGLEMISQAMEGRERAAFVFRPTEEVRRYLVRLGVDQPGMFNIQLESSRIPEIAERIQAVRVAATSGNARPWGGAHCAISESSHIEAGDGQALFRIGLLEFDGDASSAIELGLRLAENLVAASYVDDASWVARNLLARPGADALTRARASAVMARCAATLGQLDDARAHLGAAQLAFQVAAVPLPWEFVEWVFMFHVQLGDADTALRWAQTLADKLSGDTKRSNSVLTLAAQLDTWGESMMPVASVLRHALALKGIAATRSSAVDSVTRFRLFSGYTAQAKERNAQAASLLDQAQTALSERNAAKAIALVDELAALGTIPEYQAAVGVALQIQALAATHSPSQLEAAAKVHRERLLGSLAFTALARLEAAMAWAAILAGELSRAAEGLRRNGWVAELCDDPIARASLRALVAIGPALDGQPLEDDERAREALQAAAYFGLPETRFSPIASASAAPRPADRDIAEEHSQSLAQIFRESGDVEAVDAALCRAVSESRAARQLSPVLLANWRGDRANWALRMQRFEEAIRGYRRVERSFRAQQMPGAALNAMAGRARALSRRGDYAEAVRVFELAVAEADKVPIRANLLLGLGTAHLQQASRVTELSKSELIDKAIVTFKQAIATASLSSPERANARLALARALGEKGDRNEALDAFDLAVAELAHVGSPSAKLLQEHRDHFVAGGWDSIGLM